MFVLRRIDFQSTTSLPRVTAVTKELVSIHTLWVPVLNTTFLQGHGGYGSSRCPRDRWLPFENRDHMDVMQCLQAGHDMGIWSKRGFKQHWDRSKLDWNEYHQLRVHLCPILVHPSATKQDMSVLSLAGVMVPTDYDGISTTVGEDYLMFHWDAIKYLHKAVAEVSRIDNYRGGELLWCMDGRANPLMDQQVVGVVLFGVVAVVNSLTTARSVA